jgi:hypothetical protein
MEKLSINRALAELKLIDSKITTSISQVYVGVNTNDEKERIQVVDCDLHDFNSKAEFEKECKAKYQSALDLIARKNMIKSKIMESNAITKVKVGKKDYTVVAAIQQKQSIKSDYAQMIKRLRRLFDGSTTLLQNSKEQVEEKTERIVSAALQTQKDSKKDEMYKALGDQIKNSHQYNLVDPISLSTEIDRLQSEADEFTANIDYLLTESNAKTFIELN